MPVSEEWKPIEGYEGRYSISNLGRVKRNACVIVDKNGFDRKLGEKILKGTKCSNGYRAVPLSDKGVVSHPLIHRLVASAFISNDENLPVVNHKDHNRANNVATNLEWCTRSENTQYAHMNDRKAAKQKLTVDQVRYIKDNAISGKNRHHRGNVRQLAEMFGVSIQTVQHIIAGRTWSYI